MEGIIIFLLNILMICINKLMPESLKYWEATSILEETG